jgi:hypothetical protein
LKKLVTALLGICLLAGITVAPASGAHSDGTTRHPNNYAGRPLSGDSYGADMPTGQPPITDIHCQMLAYGKVAGDPVLFTANHCTNIHTLGQTIVDHNGNPFGTIPTSRSHCSALYDLCFIWLNGTSKFPHNPHQIYGGRDGDGDAQWTTLSTSQGSSQWNCGAMPARIGYNVYASRQNVISNAASPRTGEMIGYSSASSSTNPCDIITDYVPTGGRWSGTPITNCYLGTCSLVGVGRSIDGNGDLHFGNIREGISHINAIWSSQGGARFCTTANC